MSAAVPRRVVAVAAVAGGVLLERHVLDRLRPLDKRVPKGAIIAQGLTLREGLQLPRQEPSLWERMWKGLRRVGIRQPAWARRPTMLVSNCTFKLAGPEPDPLDRLLDVLVDALADLRSRAA